MERTGRNPLKQEAKCTKCKCDWKLHVNYDPLIEIPPPAGDYNEIDKLPAPPTVV